MGIRERLRGLLSDEYAAAESGENAAVVVVFDEGRDGLAGLFIRRRSNEGDPWSGQVAFPGGRAHEGDATLLDTARRELYEEVGLKLDKDVHLLGAMRPVNPGNIPTMRVTPFIGILAGRAEPRRGDEPLDVFWIPLRELRYRVCSVHSKTRGVMQVRAFVYDNMVIWGMTARILRELLNALEPL
ncbi:MAG: CoA pyrophosphatase [Aigarchaeota archaeon]|nr:CoA pyrophosphatase [Candidatus Pelearchaeum maunauluense]